MCIEFLKADKSNNNIFKHSKTFFVKLMQKKIELEYAKKKICYSCRYC